MKAHLPGRKIHKTPRLLMPDAYTIGSDEFESEPAKDKSTYYITFRKLLETIKTGPYTEGDTRYIFNGLARIIDYLFYEPVTHEEIDTTKLFLSTAKVTTKGLANYSFPEALWRRVVDEFEGYPPIQIKAFLEGSVVYPNEPAVEIKSTVKGFGEMAAQFESKLLMVWAATEMTTQLEHWLIKLKKMVRKARPDLTEDEVDFTGRLMLHNFGDRAGITPEESEWLGETFLDTFSGTDTFAGAYQAWENAGRIPGIAVSVKALAHRNVQSYEKEFDCFRALYNSMENGDIGSFVADCNNFFYAVEGDQSGTDGSLLSLALESKRTGNGKVVVGRPDSGDAVEQVIWLCKLAVRWGLYETITIGNKEWKVGTYLKVIEGDGMTWDEMTFIMQEMLKEGLLPWGWGVPFGVGGGLRNYLKRDNSSAKYALCAVGANDRPVVKFSETLGKTTLPGPFKVLRTPEALDSKKTILFANEEGEDTRVIYYEWDGTQDQPFGEGYIVSNQPNRKKRISEQLTIMPLSLSTDENHGYPASDAVRAKRIELLKEYAPKKLAQNY